MAHPAVEAFAALLVQRVRDVAIQNADALLQPNAGSPAAKRWKKAASGPASAVAKVVIPDCVDETIFALLNAIDEGALRLSFTGADGTPVDLTKEGLSELAGWYMGSGGWRAQHSKERYVDDFADLT